MRILDVRSFSSGGDVRSARRILAAEIEDPNKVLLIIRGDSPEIGMFAERARHATDGVGFREAIWVRNTVIFEDGQEEAWFGDDQNACAVVLNFGDEPVGLLSSDDTLFRIDQLLREAIRS